MTNPILRELYDIRREIMDEHGDNLTEYLRVQFEQAKAAGHPIAKIKQRSIRRSETVASGNLTGESRE